ncbi:hypothetical protein B0I33_10763 [Prauserella shujinwangii]|uniref:DUF1365 family protein n=1 Tax=Prauserella shujinwangii TaxID=1453103 RepID=A0A2T0LS43_9PSEU|nr:DUF1365 domain-containing protein [Prauserella shujinwangii]PRX46486.1 hypothetical protein B0I33_10763 [Prauserella shujinwangii]
MTAPALYDATVAHVRHVAPPLSFAHRLHLWLVDLDDLPALPRPLRPFARFDPRDHFRAGDDRPIRVKLDSWLAGRGVDLAGGRVLMLTGARVLGHVFNPITLYWCHRPGGEQACVVAEVHNTHGGRHAYLLFPDHRGAAGAGKEFFVSPFQDSRGHYRMRLPRPDALLSASVVLSTGGAPALTASLRGVRRPATPAALLRMLLSRPFVPHRVSALIRRHGTGLWLRRAPRPRVATRLGALNG